MINKIVQLFYYKVLDNGSLKKYFEKFEVDKQITIFMGFINMVFADNQAQNQKDVQ